MDALLLGRRTYQIFADYWPGASEEIPFTGLLNGVPKYLASRTLAGPLAWPGSTLLAGGLAEGNTAIKGRHDEVHVIGSPDLVQSPLRSGLVDRRSLWLNLPQRHAPTRLRDHPERPHTATLAIEEHDPQRLPGDG